MQSLVFKSAARLRLQLSCGKYRQEVCGTTKRHQRAQRVQSWKEPDPPFPSALPLSTASGRRLSRKTGRQESVSQQSGVWGKKIGHGILMKESALAGLDRKYAEPL